MSRTELVELLERGAGPPPHAVDPSVVWRRGRRRRRAKRAGAAGTVAAVVALGVVVVLPWWDGRGPGIDIAPADGPATVELPEVVLPDVQADRAELAALAEPTGSRLVATYDGAATFVDVDRQEAIRRQLPELAPGDPPYRLIAADRLVLWGGERTYAMDPNPDAELEPINEASTWSVFVPSGLSDRFWVRLGTTDGRPAPISQVDVDGNMLIGGTESPGGNLVIGLHDTVVLQTDRGLVVWDPRADRIVERLSAGVFPMGSDGRSFAWCNQDCRRLSITDPAAGTTRLLAEVPEGVEFAGYRGQLSPDGRYLASPLCATDTQRCALVVIDLDRDLATTIADGWLPAGALPAWSPDSRRVFVPLEDGRLATYRPGTPEATIVQVEPIAAPYGFGVLAGNRAAPQRPDADVVRLDPTEVTPLAAAASTDPSLKGHVVRDTATLAQVWNMADIEGEPPTLPDGTVGILVFAREAESTCRSPDDVVGVEIAAGEVIVLLDPQGEFLRPCPGPEGAHAWTAFALAIPDQYDHDLTGAGTLLADR
jgi:hypothetical protein